MVLLKIARNLDQAQKQEFRPNYSRSKQATMEEIGFLAIFTSLVHIGMIFWEDVRGLKEGLLANLTDEHEF